MGYLEWLSREGKHSDYNLNPEYFDTEIQDQKLTKSLKGTWDLECPECGNNGADLIFQGVQEISHPRGNKYGSKIYHIICMTCKARIRIPSK